MGTQWVVRSAAANSDDFGSRPTYQPRHAKPRRDQLPTSYPGDQVHALVAAEDQPTQFGVSGYRADGCAQVPARRGLRNRAATFVRARSRR